MNTLERILTEPVLFACVLVASDATTSLGVGETLTSGDGATTVGDAGAVGVVGFGFGAGLGCSEDGDALLRANATTSASNTTSA